MIYQDWLGRNDDKIVLPLRGRGREGDWIFSGPRPGVNKIIALRAKS